MIRKITRWIKRLSEGITDKYCFSILGKDAYIRNGKSHFMGGDDQYLIENKFVELGLGRVQSGNGDWASGTNHVTTSPLKLTIDKHLVIHKIETDSFYNSPKSKSIEKKARKIAAKLEIGKEFKVKNKILKDHLKRILNVIPADKPIGHDVFRSPHMIDHYTKSTTCN